MLTAVKGTYDHGQIVLHETPPVQERTEVIVTFLEKEEKQAKKPRKAGSLAGRGSIPADFNKPLDDPGLNEPYLNPEPTESRFRYNGKWYVRDKAGNVIAKDI